MYNPRLSKGVSMKESISERNDMNGTLEVGLSTLMEEIEIVEGKKKEALEEEDYATALELKNRLKTLNADLLRIEYSFFGDLYSNFVTKWANDICKVIATQAFKDSSHTIRKSCSFALPLDAPCQVRFRELVKTISPFYFETILKSMLTCFPIQDSPFVQTKSMGIERFFSRGAVSTVKISTYEFHTVALILCTLDIISQIIIRSDPNNITKQTSDDIINHAFNYVRKCPTLFKKIQPQVARYLKYQIDIRFAAVLGDLSRISFSEIMQNYDDIIANRRRYSNDELIHMFSLMKHIQFRIESGEIVECFDKILEELNVLISEAKRPIMKNAIIQFFDRIVQNIEFKDSIVIVSADILNEWKKRVWEKNFQLFVSAKEWMLSEELEASACFLICTILSKYRKNPEIKSFLDEFICVHLMSRPIKDKKRCFVFDCLLRLLWNDYNVDCLDGHKHMLQNQSYFPKSWFSSMDLQFINSNLIGKILKFVFELNSNYRVEVLDTIVHLGVQMAFYRMNDMLNTVLPRLYSAIKSGSFGDTYVGIRILKIILCPDFEFIEKAKTGNIKDLEKKINEHIEFNTELLSDVCMQCELLVGVKRSGARNSIFDETNLAYDNCAKDLFIDLYNKQMWGVYPAWSESNFGENFDFKTSYRLDRTPPNPWFRRPNTKIDKKIEIDHEFLATQFPEIKVQELNYENCSENQVENILYRIFSLAGIQINLKNLRMEEVTHEDIPFEDEPTHNLDNIIAANIYNDFLLIIDMIPLADFHYGKYFMGYHILNCNLDIAYQACHAVIRIFKQSREIRFQLLNSVLNLSKVTDVQSVNGLFNILILLNNLLEIWIRDAVKIETQSTSNKDEFFERLSNKFDAVILFALSKAASKPFRIYCFRILHYFETLYTVVKGASPKFPSLLRTLRKEYQSISNIGLHSYTMFVQRDEVNMYIDETSFYLPLHHVILTEYPTLWSHYYWAINRAFAENVNDSMIVLQSIIKNNPTYGNTKLPTDLSGNQLHLCVYVTKSEQDFLSQFNIIYPALYYCKYKTANDLNGKRSTVGHLLMSLKSGNQLMIEGLSHAISMVNDETLLEIVVFTKNWLTNELEAIVSSNPKFLISLAYFIRGIVLNVNLKDCFAIPLIVDKDIDFIQNLLYFSRKIEFLIESLDKIGTSMSVSEMLDLFISYLILVNKLCHIIHPTYLVFEKIEKVHGFENYCFTREPSSFAPGVTKEFSERTFRLLSEIKIRVEKLQNDQGSHRLTKTLRKRWEKTFAAVCAIAKHFHMKDVPDENLRQITMIEKSKVSILPHLLRHHPSLFLDFCICQCYSRRHDESLLFFRALSNFFGLFPTDIELSNYIEFSQSDMNPETRDIEDPSYCLIINPLDDKPFMETVSKNFGQLLFIGLYFGMHRERNIRIDSVLFIVRFLPILINVESMGRIEKSLINFYANPDDQVSIKHLCSILLREVEKKSSFVCSYIQEAIRAMKLSGKMRGRNRFLVNEEEWILFLLESWIPHISFSDLLESDGSGDKDMFFDLLSLMPIFPQQNEGLITALQPIFATNKKPVISEFHAFSLLSMISQYLGNSMRSGNTYLNLIEYLFQEEKGWSDLIKRYIVESLRELPDFIGKAADPDPKFQLSIGIEFCLEYWARYHGALIDPLHPIQKQISGAISIFRHLYFSATGGNEKISNIIPSLVVSSLVNLKLPGKIETGLYFDLLSMLTVEDPYYLDGMIGKEISFDFDFDCKTVKKVVKANDFIKGLIESMVEKKDLHRIQVKCQEEMVKYLISSSKAGDMNLETIALLAISFLRIEPQSVWSPSLVEAFGKDCLRSFCESKGKRMTSFVRVFLKELLCFVKLSDTNENYNIFKLFRDYVWSIVSLLTIPTTNHADIVIDALAILRSLLERIPLHASSKSKIEIPVPGGTDSFKGFHRILSRFMYEQPLPVELDARYCLIKLWYLLPKSMFDPSPLSFLYILLGCMSWICIHLSETRENVALLAANLKMADKKGQLLGLVSFFHKVLCSKCAKEAEEIIGSLSLLINDSTSNPEVINQAISMLAVNLTVLFVPEVVDNLQEYLINLLTLKSTGGDEKTFSRHVKNFVVEMFVTLVQRNGAEMYKRSLSILTLFIDGDEGVIESDSPLAKSFAAMLDPGKVIQDVTTLNFTTSSKSEFPSLPHKAYGSFDEAFMHLLFNN